MQTINYLSQKPNGMGSETPEADDVAAANVQESSSGDVNPAIPALLSAVGLIFPIAAGAGQFYNGETKKAVAFSVIQIVNALLILVMVGLVTYPIVGLYAVYDAYKNA